MQNLQIDLIELLKSDARFVNKDGKLLKATIVANALQLDAPLLKLLLSHPLFKKTFFADIDGILIFDKIKFQTFVTSKQFLPDSYTSFKNKIGLMEGDDYLTTKGDVVLAWGYKDCVLEGGQTKDDAKSNEIFWNETLAPEQVDKLVAPKVLTGFKRHDKDGVHDVEELKDDDNFIVKGNNLQALHTLYQKFGGKVKLIYIDPPYNTGSDSFKYNDSFNHSTWLTFMKNRLEVAREILSSDGSIFIQCDDVEVHYLKVLCDEIFRRENFISTICVKMSHASGVKMAHSSFKIPKIKEFVLFYSKEKTQISLNPQFEVVSWSEALDRYKSIIINYNEPLENWLVKPLNELIKENVLDLKNEKLVNEFLIGNSFRIFRTARNESIIANDIKNKFRREKSARGLERIVFNNEEVLFASDKLQIINGEKFPVNALGDIWLDIGINNLHNEGYVDFKNGKKPEKLIERIIHLSTKPNDLVLDYHLGSGTTAAVAHKMGRRYIGIEQMDYIDTITIPRLEKVIAGEQGGVSKAHNWQGGGSFVSCELLKDDNHIFIDKIQASTDEASLKTSFEKMKEKAFLKIEVELDKIDFNDVDFKALSLDEKKRMLIETLDKNTLYVNLSDIDDEELKIDTQTKKLNSFFKRGQ